MGVCKGEAPLASETSGINIFIFEKRMLISNEDEIDTASTAKKIRVMQKLGVPYEEGYDQIANQDLMKQADDIAASLKADNIETASNMEIIAIIAYLQRLGVDINAETNQQQLEK